MGCEKGDTDWSLGWFQWQSQIGDTFEQKVCRRSDEPSTPDGMVPHPLSPFRPLPRAVGSLSPVPSSTASTLGRPSGSLRLSPTQIASQDQMRVPGGKSGRPRSGPRLSLFLCSSLLWGAPY